MSNSKLRCCIFFFFFIFLLFACSTSCKSSFNTTTRKKCSARETHALLLFKESLFSINDTFYHLRCEYWLGVAYTPIMMSWNTNTDCCNWQGVNCHHSTGEVIGIDVSCGMLSGTIHPNTSLFNLPHLRMLNLAFNDFADSKLPREIGKFANSLTHLNISDCRFSGRLPTDITLLSKLVSLDLSLNLFDFNVGSYFFNNLVQNFTKLEKLSLKGMSISSVLPATLNISYSLKFLNLRKSGFEGKLPHNLFNLQSLETLDLSWNSFTDDVPWEISLLPKLVSLDLSWNGNEFDDLKMHPHIFESLLKNSTFLKGLSLAEVNIGLVLPANLTLSSSLKLLDLGNTNLRGKLPNGIFNLQSLEVLDLSENNNLIGQLPKSLVSLTHLTSLDLSSNQLNGALPSWLFNLPYLDTVSLGHNMFSGNVPFKSSTLPLLESLDLGHNQLSGHIDVQTFRKLTNLTYLDLSFNSFRGDWEFDTLLSSLTNLLFLDLSYNSFSITTSNANHYVNCDIQMLYLASCKLKVFPESLRAMRNLGTLDLSSNEIHGQIPHWAGEIGTELHYLNLSHNFITGLPQFQWSGLYGLHLQSNLIQGPFPPSICNMSNLQSLDMSKNSFDGVIPECLANISSSLTVIDLGNNIFHGTIPDVYDRCGELLGFLLNGNELEGDVPSSLSKCRSLKVLDLGNNVLNGTFPVWLQHLLNLQVIVLKSNKFHGIIKTSSSRKLSFPCLRVLDLSHNGFVGHLPKKYFQNFNAMKNFVRDTQIEYLNMNGKYYSIIVSVKDQQLPFPKISVEYIIVDLSSNMFEGEIPNSIGTLTSLIVLNLSHNSLTGPIPHALGNLIEIESLDLSCNHLTGIIPQSLAKITTLEVLNISQNDLEGRIPLGKQFNTFGGNSYGGDPKLCGIPLTKTCGEHLQEPQLEADEDHEEASGFTWKVVMLGYGCGTLLGLVMGYLMWSTRKVKWFNR